MKRRLALGVQAQVNIRGDDLRPCAGSDARSAQLLDSGELVDVMPHITHTELINSILRRTCQSLTARKCCRSTTRYTPQNLKSCIISIPFFPLAGMLPSFIQGRSCTFSRHFAGLRTSSIHPSSLSMQLNDHRRARNSHHFSTYHRTTRASVSLVHATPLDYRKLVSRFCIFPISVLRPCLNRSAVVSPVPLNLRDSVAIPNLASV